mmetsp:Transcript_1304/g.3163  ORF Transcript_1304/g.3163 Transcript_1304/m.3163 type:complete len:669 (-) Transcript_1304:121-2127(-)
MAWRRVAFLLLLVLGLVAGADHEDAHGHGEEDHDGHGHGEGPFEWAGAFEMGVGLNTLTLSKVGGKYAADRMLVTVHRLGKAGKLQDSLEPAAETFEHAMEHMSEEDSLACGTSGLEWGTKNCPMSLSQGGVMELAGLEPASEEGHGHEGGEEGHEDHEEDGHEDHEEDGHDHHEDDSATGARREDHEDHEEEGHSTSKVYVLEMDQDSPMTLFKMDVAEAGLYAIVAEHAMSEFDGDVHYLKGPDGGDVVAVEEFPAKAECTGDGKLNISQVWGYSIAGSIIGAAMSLSGALFLLCFAKRDNFGASLAHFNILNAFAAGVLIGLVFVHLLPEAVALNGSFDWVVSVCLVAGLFLGLLTEHLLHLLGFEHKHSGHSRALAPGADPAKEELLASREAGTLRREAPVQMPPHGLGVPGYNFAGPGVPYPVPQMGFGGYDTVSSHLGFPTAPVPPTSHTRNVAVSGGAFGTSAEPHRPADAKTLDVEGSAHSLTQIDYGTAINVFVGDFFHNLFDGVAIGTAFLSCGALGWVVTASVVAHELPQEISDFFILLRAGLSVPHALLSNVGSSASSVLGVIIVILIQQGGADGAVVGRDIGRMLSFSAGILLYVAFGLLGDIPRTVSTKASAASWFVLCLGVVVNGVLLLWHVHCEECGAVGGGHEGGHDGHGH